MATVNFSVPDEVKEAFNRVFSGENKSAIIADLMRGAVEEHQRRRRRARSIDRLLTRRSTKAPVSAPTIRAARRRGRP